MEVSKSISTKLCSMEMEQNNSQVAICIPLDTIPQRDRQTNRRTDGRTELVKQYIALRMLCVLRREYCYCAVKCTKLQFIHKLMAICRNDIQNNKDHER